MKLSRRLDRLESEVEAEGAGLTEHNITWGNLRRFCSEEQQEEVIRWLLMQWQEVKDDPVLELPAVWFARAIRCFLWTDFRRDAPAVQRWLYNGGTPRVSTSRLMGFDKLMVERGWYGLYDHGNANSFRYSTPEPIEDELARRFAEVHAQEPVDQNRYYR